MTNRMIPALLIAATTLTAQVSVSSAETVPSFLQGVEASPMTQSEMESVRGELIPAVIIAFVAKRVATAVGAWAGVKIADMLRGERLPNYAEYKAAFGSKTAKILALLPTALKPKIAQ